MPNELTPGCSEFTDELTAIQALRAEPPIVTKLRTVDTQRLTPLEALTLLDALARDASAG